MLANTAVTSQVCCFKQLTLHGKLWKMLFSKLIGSLNIGWRPCVSMNSMQILKIAASNTVVNFVMQPWVCSVREMFNPDTVPDTQALGSFKIAWPGELCSVQNEQRGRICPLGRTQKTVSQFRIYKEVYSKALVFSLNSRTIFQTKPYLSAEDTTRSLGVT